jgi:hypothetical protein
MKFKFSKINYSDLDGRQQEVFNFQWLSGVLATYGYHTHRIPDDWLGADFIARHMVTNRQLKVQLKSRLHFAEKYRNKDIWIAFRYGARGFLFPHDKILRQYMKINSLRTNRAWHSGNVHWSRPTKALLALLAPYELSW